MNQILVIDDHPLFRDALSSAIQLVIPDNQIHYASTFQEGKSLLAGGIAFDLVLLDLMLPDANGMSGLATVRASQPNARIVLVSGREEDGVIRSARSFGADAFIGKSCSMADFASKLQQVLWGNRVFPPVEDDAASRRALQGVADLSAAQTRILLAVADGKLNKQIAYDFNLSEATVKSHLTSIYRKLGVFNRTQAVLLARELLPETANDAREDSRRQPPSKSRTG